MAAGEETLGRAVPPRADVLRVRRVGEDALAAAEVGQLDFFVAPQ